MYFFHLESAGEGVEIAEARKATRQDAEGILKAYDGQIFPTLAADQQMETLIETGRITKAGGRLIGRIHSKLETKEIEEKLRSAWKIKKSEKLAVEDRITKESPPGKRMAIGNHVMMAMEVSGLIQIELEKEHFIVLFKDITAEIRSGTIVGFPERNEAAEAMLGASRAVVEKKIKASLYFDAFPTATCMLYRAEEDRTLEAADVEYIDITALLGEGVHIISSDAYRAVEEIVHPAITDLAEVTAIASAGRGGLAMVPGVDPIFVQPYKEARVLELDNVFGAVKKTKKKK